jgi:hypothetical protein
MANDYRRVNGKSVKGFVEQSRLRGGRPNVPSRASAVAKAGPVEGDDAMRAYQRVDHATGFPVVSRHAVSVQQHDGRPFTFIGVVEARLPDIGEAPARRMAPFGAASRGGVEPCANSEGGGCNRSRPDSRRGFQ